MYNTTNTQYHLHRLKHMIVSYPMEFHNTLVKTI